MRCTNDIACISTKSKEKRCFKVCFVLILVLVVDVVSLAVGFIIVSIVCSLTMVRIDCIVCLS